MDKMILTEKFQNFIRGHIHMNNAECAESNQKSIIWFIIIMVLFYLFIQYYAVLKEISIR